MQASTADEKYRFIIANMQEGYYETDLAGNFTAFNAVTRESLGRDSQEMLRTNLRDCMDAPTAQRVFEQLNEVHRTGQPAQIVECNLIRKDGGVRTHELSVSLLKNVAGEPIGFFGVFRDRTEQLRMERDLRESEESYRRVMELAPDNIAISRLRDGQYFEVNEAFCQNTKYSREEIIGRTAVELNLYENLEDRARFLETLRACGRVDAMAVNFRAKDGSPLIDLLSARIIQFKGEACILAMATVINPLVAAQQALQESEKRYREILDATPDVISLTTLADGRYVEVNSAFYQHTGYTPEETIGRTSTELNLYADPNDRDRFIDALRKNGRVEGIEMPVRHKDGTLSMQLWSGRIIQQKGQACLLVAAKPIDDLKSAQQALADSEESYRRIMELAPDMVVITRASDGCIVAVNDAFCARTGYSREEAVGHTPVALGLYANLENRREWMDMLRRDGKVQGLELQFLTRSGTIQDDLFSAQYIRFKGEDCILAVITSITNLKRIQRAMRESEARFRAIFETAADAIFVNDLGDGRFLDVNQAACLHLGYAEAELHGKSLNDILDPQSRYPKPAQFQGQAAAGRLFFETIHVHKNGTKIPVEVSRGTVARQGRPALLSIVRDISARKRAELELARYRLNLEQMVAERTRELEAAQIELIKRERLAVLGQLTATVSHELRNPLGVIRSSNFYLQRKAKDKDEKELKHFRRIDEQVALCDTIVADLLEYTRGRRANMVRQAFGEWLPQVVEQMRESEGLVIELRLPADLPPWPHDQEKMRRVMINVLDNAVQAVQAQEKTLKGATPAYRPSIVVEAEQQVDGVILTIGDNGIGMDEETCRRAFEPLFTTRARGTGIGLANVKKIVEEHGGRIELESRPGLGTRMKILLPCQPPAHEA